MKNSKLEWRMYGLVPYNLSPIQQGIQFGHAVQEYNNKMQDLELTDKGDKLFESFHRWRLFDKTFIILNGGTTNYRKKGGSAEYVGTLNEHALTLTNHEVEVAGFDEPDLGDQLTGVVFLVDERVWDRDKYPDFVPTNGLIQSTSMQPGYGDWKQSVGGSQNVWLRDFLKQFKLA
jgi:hypothetical protein